MLHVPNYWVRLACFTVMGVCGLRNGASLAWLGGFLPAEYKSLMIGIVMAFDAATLMIIVFYFGYISSNWYPLFLFMTCVGLLAHLFMCYVSPDSPAWLLSQGRTEDAINALNKIGQINKCENLISH